MLCGKLTAGVTLQVQAPLATVWNVINDFESIPKYNPTYLNIERIPCSSQESSSKSSTIQPNDQFRVEQKGGHKKLKNVTSIKHNAEECSITFVESCTSTYSLIVKAIDDKSCWLIGTFGASPNNILVRYFFLCCGCCLMPMAERTFSSMEIQPVANEAERREKMKATLQDSSL